MRLGIIQVGSVKDHCVNTNVFGWINARVNIAVDFWRIAFPLFRIGRLRLHWKKIGAALMLMTGLL